jgi:hypothetical protein
VFWNSHVGVNPHILKSIDSAERGVPILRDSTHTEDPNVAEGAKAEVPNPLRVGFL